MVAAHRRHARGEGPGQGLGAKGTRGAHVEHGAHGCDAGGVKAQRLVEGRRVLPSRREGMLRCGGERWEPGGGRAWGVMAAHKRHARGTGPIQGLGAKGTRGERTWNMAYMVVTLEVSKLSGWLKADASCRVGGRACDAGGRGGSREAGGPGVWWRHTRGTHGNSWPDSRLGGQGHARSARRTCCSWS